MAWSDRPSLDGLRAVAVYLVVCFHAGMATFGGGFVGVDLFFVLSGFLVATILLQELDGSGRIDLPRFYARRVRRLLPAALVAIVGTAVMFQLVAPTVRRLPYVGDAQSALLYVANWRFLAQSQDYFAEEGAARSPYLHYWSLSIEEQFYVVFPLVLLGLVWLARRHRSALTVGVLALFGLAVSAQVVWSVVEPSHAYYGTDARAYQPLAGVVAALVWRGRAGRPGAPVPTRFLTALGLVGVIVVATPLVDAEPGARGLVATAASVAVVLGLAFEDRQPVGRALGLRPVRYLGRVSYGTYLWHWPVTLVLLQVVDARPLVIAAGAAVLATGLATLSFEVLEHPLRTGRRLAVHSRSTVLVGITASIAVAVALVPPVLERERLPVTAADSAAARSDLLDRPTRPVPRGVDWAAWADDKGPEDAFCTRDDPESCVVVENGGPSVLLVGDSHARLLAPTMEALAREHGFSLALAIVKGCPWKEGLVNVARTRADQERCRTSRQALYGGLVEELGIDVVVASAMPRERASWLTNLETSRDYDSIHELTLDATRASLDALTGQGAEVVIVEAMLSVPDELGDPLACLSAARTIGECRVPVPARAPRSDGYYRTFATGSESVHTVSINSVMCPRAPVCEAMLGRRPVWRNANHYAARTVSARSEQVWPLLRQTGVFTPSS